MVAGVGVGPAVVVAARAKGAGSGVLDGNRAAEGSPQHQVWRVVVPGRRHLGLLDLQLLGREKFLAVGRDADDLLLIAAVDHSQRQRARDDSAAARDVAQHNRKVPRPQQRRRRQQRDLARDGVERRKGQRKTVPVCRQRQRPRRDDFQAARAPLLDLCRHRDLRDRAEAERIGGGSLQRHGDWLPRKETGCRRQVVERRQVDRILAQARCHGCQRIARAGLHAGCGDAAQIGLHAGARDDEDLAHLHQVGVRDAIDGNQAVDTDAEAGGNCGECVARLHGVRPRALLSGRSRARAVSRQPCPQAGRQQEDGQERERRPPKDSVFGVRCSVFRDVCFVIRGTYLVLRDMYCVLPRAACQVARSTKHVPPAQSRCV